MPTDRSIARQHAEWLSLMEVSGPFLSMPVLLESFRHGLDVKENEAEVRRRLRLAYEEWADNQEGPRPDPAIHTQWLRFVLEEVLELRPDTLLEGQRIPPEICYEAKDHGKTLRPTLVIRSPFEQKPRLLIQLYPKAQGLEKVIPEKHWKASPATRMMELLRSTGMRLGLVTNGEQWMLVDAPANETTGYYSWYSTLWLEEPLTLAAFRSLLSMGHFFNVPEDETLEALLTRSAMKQQEVTDQLGDQVRRAVEMLVQTLDRLDKDSQRTLLGTLDEKELYEAALTVMMRLVFLLSAEERGMLLLGDPLYDQHYAVSTMHKQLREQADQQAEEVLGLRFDAWSRLLAAFRMVYGGVEHADLRLPAYGGHLFDPDRFPFLEGRKPGTSWRDAPAAPLLIDNRTVLYLLNALQYLQVRIPGGSIEPRRLSFRGLDVEQIGHVYEGLLDHTAKRATTTILGLVGTGDSEPETSLETLEEKARKGQQELLNYLNEITGRSVVTLQKNLTQPVEKQQERSRLMEACDNKQDLFDRVLPFASLLRRDSFSNFVLVTPGSIYVTKGSDRRSTGTHYTPRSLTEPIVQHALDPLVYIGPAEGLPQEQWKLRSAADILDLKVCDMAMGSGAFLVQTCRYLSEKLVEAWENVERELDSTSDNPRKLQIAPDGLSSQGRSEEELLPRDTEERLAVARRLVSERCLYGVDKNPMAVEMAKLSLWLITLAKNKPFTFLDHALRCGDSLLGASLKQIKQWSRGNEGNKTNNVRQMSLFIEPSMNKAVDIALKLRGKIRTLPEHTVRDIDSKTRMLKEAVEAMELVRLGADLLVATALCEPKRRGLIQDTLHAEYAVLVSSYEEAREQRFTEYGRATGRESFQRLRATVDELLCGRQPFHWPLEFPEVFTGSDDKVGFAAIVGNPPFQGGTLITGQLGSDYREYLVNYVAHGKRGARADLCAYFFLQASNLTQVEGHCGLIATNTIAQGDTREIGLDQMIVSGWTIYHAIPSHIWPGEASLEVSLVWLRRGKWHGSYIVDENNVEGISAYLKAGKVEEKPSPLQANLGKSFKGTDLLGIGFVLLPEEAQALLEKESRNREVLFPFLTAEDLNSRPDQSPSRWVINFHEWPLEDAETYVDCIKIVRERVLPQRKAGSKFARKEWWLHHRTRSELYNTIRAMKRVLAIPLHSKYMICVWQQTGIIYSHGLGIIVSESNADFALLQGTTHNEWARFSGSTLETRMRYTPSDCFETFPFPSNKDGLDDIGARYHIHRQSIMLARQEGLTKTYNRFHDPQERSNDIVKLRELHKEMDEAVARAYSWDDLQLGHGFHETKQGTCYTTSEAARREVLDRLLLLNHQRHEEEVKAGLFEKGAKGKARAKKAPTAAGNREKQGNKSRDDGNIVEVESIDKGVEQEMLF